MPVRASVAIYICQVTNQNPSCIRISRYIHFRVGLSVRRPADELTDKCACKPCEKHTHKLNRLIEKKVNLRIFRTTGDMTGKYKWFVGMK